MAEALAGIFFQFPLWDTEHAGISEWIKCIKLSIPFMGYVSFLLLQFCQLIQYFQFPLWDTYYCNNEAKYVIVSFNSLYGIQYLFFVN